MIKLELIDDRVKVISPYNEVFVGKARNLRGQWKEGAWWFDDSILDYVREVMIECFGTTGETPIEYCTLLVKDYSGSNTGAIRLFERTVVLKPYNRDGYARLGDGIILVDGEATCGGSRNHPKVFIDGTFEMRDFPVPSLDLPDVKAAIEAGWVEVIPTKKKRPTEQILADIDACKARLAELENELSNL